MKRLFALATVALAVSACGSPQANFVDNCRGMAMDEGLGEDGANIACACAYDRLATTYSAGEIRQAGELLAIESDEDLRAAVARIDNGEALLENTESAVKSCAM